MEVLTIMVKKIYKSRTNVKLDGVCSGIANYFDIDPTLIRLGWIIAAIVTAMFPLLFAYVICAAIMPREPEHFTYEQ